MKKINLIHPLCALFQAVMIFLYFHDHINPAIPVFFLAWGAFWTGIYWDDISEVKP